MAMFLFVRVRNDSQKYFLPKTCFYIHMTSGAETVDLTLTGRGGGDASPHEFFFLNWPPKRSANQAEILHT